MVQNVTLVPPGGDTQKSLQVSDGPAHVDIAFERPVRQQPAESNPRPAFTNPQPFNSAPPPPQQPALPPVVSRPPPPPPPQPEELNDFANPNKIDESPDMESPQMQGEDFPGDWNDQYEQYDDYQEPPPPGPPVIQPLPPFETLEDERADLMYKLQRAARSGIQVRTFGWNADIREIRAEASRAKAEQEVDASIAFQRQILMTLCTGIEFANKKFSYLDLELDGWSESMMDDIGKFDTVFEKLHKKHAGNLNIPPELQLIFMVGGSALTWHLVAKSRGDRYKKESKSGYKKKRRRKRDRQHSDSEDSDSDISERSKQRRKYSQPATQKKEMKGPGIDMGMMGGLGGMGSVMGGLGGMGGMMGSLGGMMGGLPQVPVVDLMPQMTRQKSTAPPAEITEIDEPSPQTQSPDESERLSDIPSDLEDVPSDFGLEDSPQQQQQNETRMISIEDAKPKKGRGRPKKNDNKTVVII